MKAHGVRLSGSVRQRQNPLRARYEERPGDAWITDRGRTVWSPDLDPFHGRIRAGSHDYGLVWPFGIHRAVGGDHDLPNPGDVLSAALAACLDSTIRIIADRNGVVLDHLAVDVRSEVDVRGTLKVDTSVPVGFQRIKCDVSIRAADGTDPGLIRRIVAAAEHSCVNLQTLRNGVPVETTLTL